MLRVSFSSMTSARAAVSVLEGYGYSAKQFGRDVVTDCPTLLALPAIQQRVGFAEIERIDLNGRMDSIEPRDDFFPLSSAIRAGGSSELTA